MTAIPLARLHDLAGLAPFEVELSSAFSGYKLPAALHGRLSIPDEERPREGVFLDLFDDPADSDSLRAFVRMHGSYTEVLQFLLALGLTFDVYQYGRST